MIVWFCFELNSYFTNYSVKFVNCFIKILGCYNLTTQPLPRVSMVVVFFPSRLFATPRF